MLINNAVMKIFGISLLLLLIIPTVFACSVYLASKVDGLKGTKGEKPKYVRVYTEEEGIKESNKTTHTTNKSGNVNVHMVMIKCGYQMKSLKKGSIW